MTKPYRIPKKKRHYDFWNRSTDPAKVRDIIGDDAMRIIMRNIMAKHALEQSRRQHYLTNEGTEAHMTTLRHIENESTTIGTVLEDAGEVHTANWAMYAGEVEELIQLQRDHYHNYYYNVMYNPDALTPNVEDSPILQQFWEHCNDTIDAAKALADDALNRFARFSP